MNNLTKITNELSNFIKTNTNIIEETAIILQNKIRLVKEEIINIKYAIHWAKHGMINSILLNKNEIKLAIDTLSKESVPFTSVEEALDFSEAKMLSNETTLLYVIKIPLTSNKTYNKLILRPVKQRDSIINLPFNEILKSNNNEIFGIQNRCKEYNFITICKQNQLTNISNDTCIPRLLKSLNSSCTTSNNQHILSIDEIESGMLLLNRFNGTILIDDIKHTLVGTFLLKFHNSSIRINNAYYRNFEASALKIMPAIIQPSPEEVRRINLLSLEALNELHLNNTKEIRLLQTEDTIHQSISYGTVVILVLAILIITRTKANNTITIKGKERTIIKPIIETSTVQEKTNNSRSATLLNMPIIKTGTAQEKTNNSRSATLPNIYGGPYF